MQKKSSKKNVIKGRWYNINKKIKQKIKAKYHRIKDWKMDPKGYFLIGVNRKKKIILVGYCKFTTLGSSPINDMVATVKGKTAIEIVNTLIREKFVSTLQCQKCFNLNELKQSWKKEETWQEGTREDKGDGAREGRCSPTRFRKLTKSLFRTAEPEIS